MLLVMALLVIGGVTLVSRCGGGRQRYTGRVAADAGGCSRAAETMPSHWSRSPTWRDLCCSVLHSVCGRFLGRASNAAPAEPRRMGCASLVGVGRGCPGRGRRSVAGGRAMAGVDSHSADRCGSGAGPETGAVGRTEVGRPLGASRGARALFAGPSRCPGPPAVRTGGLLLAAQGRTDRGTCGQSGGQGRRRTRRRSFATAGRRAVQAATTGPKGRGPGCPAGQRNIPPRSWRPFRRDRHYWGFYGSRASQRPPLWDSPGGPGRPGEVGGPG